jgi:hypothetical protein
MKKIYLLVISLIAISTSIFSQNVNVTGALVGNGTYPDLGSAFTAINGGAQTGATILVDIVGNTTEAVSAVLNQSAGPWATLTISPSGGASRTISGNIAGHLIDLNGADDVIIDGLNSGGNFLFIDNSNGGSLTSTIRFVNDANNNTVIRTNINGSAGNALGSGFGVIYFAGGTVTGNDGNLISTCNITASSGGTPLNAIYSSGTSTAIDNANNKVTVCNISDYFSAGSASSGLNINSNNSDWTITNNTLYQTATRTYTTGSTHSGIFITSGSGYFINNNVIGFSAPNATGTTNMIGLSSGSLGGTFPSAFTVGGVANATRFVAINCTFTAGGVVSSIQNNTIGGIAIYSSGVSTTLGTLCGIAVQGGNANIGTIIGNTIGSATAANSLYAANTAAGGVISGIYCTTTNTISIQKNNIGGVDVTGTSATTAAGFKGIEASGTGTYTISNNNIGNTLANNIRTGYLLTSGSLSNTATTPTTATGASALQGILSSATGTTMSITNNTLRGFQLSGSATTFTGINSTGAVTGTIDISSNNLGTSTRGLLAIAFATSGGILCINHSAASGACVLTANNNIFQGVSYNNECTGSFRCLNISGAVLSYTMSNNNFNNLTVNTSASTIGFLIGATNATPTVTISGNYVTTQFSNITTTGTVNYIAIGNTGSALVTNGSTTITNNILSNITYRTTTNLGAGIYWTQGNVAATTHNINVSNNVISNISNQGTASTATNFGMLVGLGNNNTISGNNISSIYGKASTAGIQTNTTSLNAAGVFSIFNNKVYDIVTSGASATATGIQSFAGPTVNLYKNKIYDIKSLAGGIVVGLQESQGTAGTTANINNNIIGKLYAPNNGFANGVTGIYSGSTVANTKNIYYNTVYLDGNCPTQSYCLFSNSTVPTNNIRNNIFSNNVTATGGSSFPSMVYFRNGVSSLGTYATTSDNNIFYAGTPGSSNIIYADGAVNALTNIQTTLANHQAFITPREVNSKTELSPFLNTTSGIGSQYLHLNPAIATQAESGAVNIVTFTDDYDAEIRQGNGGYAGTGTAPDIGADEIELLVDKVAPDISYTALSNTTCLTNPTFTATITDNSTINAIAGTKPRVYFKASTNANSLGATNDNTTNGWKWVEASNAVSPFSFTIDYSLIFGAVAAGANIQYFVTAQDLAIIPNVAINSGTFAATPVSVALTGSAFAVGGLINNYDIRSAIPTSVTIGVAGTYTSLTGVNGLFADINTKGLSGNTVANIIDASVTETGINSLNQMANGCSLANYTLTIKPNAAATTLTGSFASGALIKIKSSNVIIDGSSNGSSSQDLTITNTSATSPNTILYGSTGTTVISNSILKNCIVINGATTSYAVIVSDGLTPATAGYFNNITIQNNNIQKASAGIFVNAYPSSANGNGVNITSNYLATSGINAIKNMGIYVQGVDGATVSGNEIGNFESASGEIDRGIWFATGTTNSVIEKNWIYNLQYTGTSGWGLKV